jgi:lipid II:glycine glycyltransferase (peptidoglycan interpeptide bridge formation enzyme)
VPVTSCLAQVFGKKAFYMVASTNEKGRDVSAAYAMVEVLIQQLRARGITQFDFGGIDPVNKSASGVNHFKCGFGGQITEYLGEWEAASSEIIRRTLNFAIRQRGGRV